jgi:hypothetical protein
MDFSSVRLVASDMDGTLLNTKHELSPDFFTIFNRMRSKDILFSAASGRQYQNLYNCFPGIQDEIIFIAENGSYVMCIREKSFTSSQWIGILPGIS